MEDDDPRSQVPRRSVGRTSLERDDVRRRLRAARAFAGFKTPRDLAAHDLLQRHGIPVGRIVQTEAMKRDAEIWELQVIAQATGMPADFLLGEDPAGALSADDDIRERLERIEAKLDAVLPPPSD